MDLSKRIFLVAMVGLVPILSEAKDISVHVKGMVCGFCAQGIEKKFKSQPSVDAVDVSLENKLVKLKIKDGQDLSNEKITQILKESGYEADFGG